ncbi:lysine exporter LysO family protein [Tatumella ptyseos]|uniref:lysine exporter LysO family protein n=1 Tax=Tatumella ptyseos TaxID=82987 RepID=UPI0026EBCE9B|nr:lysine exporter LysO family protein [Tatumella ptyseos]WKX27672.1 lysine exporter LysO family protein [Tatumella ptyseos]
MQHALLAIITLFATLGLGWLVGTRCSLTFRQAVVKSVSTIVLLLLFSMGMDFAQVLTQGQLGSRIVLQALLLSGLITIFTAILLLRKPAAITREGSLPSFYSAFGGCLKAISAFIAGVALGYFTHFSLEHIGLSSNSVLYVMLFCVGVDLVGFRFGRVTRQCASVPMAALVGYILATGLFSVFTPFSWQQSLMLGSGLGWFSLSGPMVHQLAGAQMGAIAFMTDFIRELLSIVFLYFFGRRQPLAAVGLSGAAAMDSALPFIKQNCDTYYIPYAIFSGLLLTLAAPFLISLSAALL